MIDPSLQQLLDYARSSMAAGRFDGAVAAYQQAIAIAPGRAELYDALGAALHHMRRLEEASAAYQRAIELNPTLLSAHFNLSIALREQGQTDQAIEILRRSLQLSPGHPEASNDLGNLLNGCGQRDQAINLFKQALARKPDFFQAYNNLGNALADAGLPQDAVAALQKGLTYHPKSADLHISLGAALHTLGRFTEAKSSFQQAILLDPNSARAHYNLSLLLLLEGNFEQGWMEHNWRKREPGLVEMRRGFNAPEWDGSNLRDRRILVHAEQGFGDAIQFVRYLPLVWQQSPRELILMCQPELARLMQNLDPAAQVLRLNETPPEVDLQCSLLDLPMRFGTTVQTIPSRMPYVIPDPAQVEHWRARIAQVSNCTRVGVVWAGRAEHPRDRDRSIKLSALSPLTRVAGARFFSLQKGNAAQEAIDPHGFDLIDCSADLHDFVDTAALIANLDLVISIDTAVAHLAGAMGKPVWVLLPFVPDWRWMLNRSDSPWYPTMKLLRQSGPGGWDAVIATAAQMLAQFIAR